MGKLVCGVAVLLLITAGTGCHIARVDVYSVAAWSPAEPGKVAKVPADAVLVCSDEFSRYQTVCRDTGELSDLNYHLGFALRTLLADALSDTFQHVEIVTTPPGRRTAPGRDVLVIRPEFVAFEHHSPLGVRVGSYKGKLSLRIVVQDAAGKELLNKVVVMEGKAKGEATHRYELNYRAAADDAMKNVTEAVVAELRSLNRARAQARSRPGGNPNM